MNSQLYVKFEGPDISEEGVSFDDLRKTLDHLQKALWLTVSYLEGTKTPTGRPSARVRRRHTLRLMRTSQGSIVAELSVENTSQKAIDLITTWHPEEGNSLPTPVARELLSIGLDLSSEVARVRLGDFGSNRYVEIHRKAPEREPLVASSTAVEDVPTLLHGWLREVNWDKRTAQLHQYGGDCVRLRFDASLDDEMLWLATQYVEIKGYGRINSKDEWTRVQIQNIERVSLRGESFDLEGLLNDPNHKIFRSDEIVRASEPFDVDEFNRIIREGRDV